MSSDLSSDDGNYDWFFNWMLLIALKLFDSIFVDFCLDLSRSMRSNRYCSGYLITVRSRNLKVIKDC